MAVHELAPCACLGEKVVERDAEKAPAPDPGWQRDAPPLMQPAHLRTPGRDQRLGYSAALELLDKARRR